MSAENRVSDLITIANDLCDIMMTENQALEENHGGIIKDLFERKDALSRAYERGVEGLRKMPPSELKAIDRDLTERLQAVGTKMDQLANDNAKLLRIAIAANQTVMDAVAEAVKASTPTAGTYGANGVQAGVQRAPQSVALSLNKTL